MCCRVLIQSLSGVKYLLAYLTQVDPNPHVGKGVLDEVTAALEHIPALQTLILPHILHFEHVLQLFHLNSQFQRRFSHVAYQ